MLPRWAVIRDARRRQRRRLRRRALLLLTLAALGGAWLAQRSIGGPQRADPAAGTARSSVAFTGYITGAQTDGDRIWVDTCVRLCGAADTGLDSERLLEINASTGAVLRRLSPLTNVTGYTAAGDSLWVAHALSGEVTRLNPSSGLVTAALHLRLPRAIAGHDRRFLPDALSYAHGYVWASTARGWLAQIDAGSGRLLRMLRTPSEDNSTATDRYGTWVAEDLDGIGVLAPRATKLRLQTVMQSGLPLDVYGLFADDAALFALAGTYTTTAHSPTWVLSIDPRSGRVVHRTAVPTQASGAALVDGAFYLADFARGRIFRVGRGGRLETFAGPRLHAFLATGSAGALWAAENVGPNQTRGRLVRIALPLRRRQRSARGA